MNVLLLYLLGFTLTSELDNEKRKAGRTYPDG